MYEDLRMIATSTLGEIRRLRNDMANPEKQNKIDNEFRQILLRIKDYFIRKFKIKGAKDLKKEIIDLEKQVHKAIKDNESVTGPVFTKIFEDIGAVSEKVEKLQKETLEADKKELIGVKFAFS